MQRVIAHFRGSLIMKTACQPAINYGFPLNGKVFPHHLGNVIVGHNVLTLGVKTEPRAKFCKLKRISRQFGNWYDCLYTLCPCEHRKACSAKCESAERFRHIATSWAYITIDRPDGRHY